MSASEQCTSATRQSTCKMRHYWREERSPRRKNREHPKSAQFDVLIAGKGHGHSCKAACRALLRGMLIPLALLVAMNLGYGCVLVSRPATSLKVEAAYLQNQTQTVERELNKARKDEQYYKSARPVWALLTAISVLLFFVFSGNYCRGL